MSNYIIRNGELYHHGIKGMKWGVRRTPDELKNARTERFTLKKGTTIHRVSGVKNETNSGHAYASFKPKDSIGYVKRSLLYNTTSFDMTMRVTKDLVSPSKKERVDAFVELCSQDKDFLSDLATATSNLMTWKDPKKVESEYRKMNERELRAKAYNDLALQVGFDSTVRNKYIKNLSDKGFNMMIDDVDATYLSNSPIMVFDRGDTLEVISTNKITKDYLKRMKRATRS